MKYYISLILILLLYACSSDKHAGEGPVVATSTPALAWITEQIAGDDLKVISLLPAGADAESYEPEMQSMKNLANADLLFYINNPGFEGNLASKVNSGIAGDIDVVDISKGVKRIHNSHAGGEDPHILTSPRNARIITANILESLTKQYPNRREAFAKRAASLDSLLSVTDSEIHRMLEASKGASFVSIHPSLSYFAERYGQNQLTLEQEGKEPSPRELEIRLKQASDANPRALFYERSHNPEQAEVYAKRIGVRAYPIDFNAADFLRQYTSIAEAIRN